MLLKLLGLFDLAAVMIILLSSVLPMKVVLYTGGLLVMKGLIFSLGGSLISLLDVLCGVLVILIAFKITSGIIILLVVLFLVQKALLSMIA